MFGRSIGVLFSALLVIAVSLYPANAQQPSASDPYDSIGYREPVAEFKAAKEALRAHLCKAPGGSIQTRVRWQADRDELLLRLVIAEEKLAFAASGSFTREDAALVEPFFRKRQQIFDLLAQAARQDAKAAELVALMREYENFYLNWEGRAGSIKPQLGMGVVVLRLAYRDLQYRLNQIEGVSGPMKQRMVETLRGIDADAVALYGAMRARGIEAINRKLGSGVRPFHIHRPSAPAQAAELERRLLIYVDSQTGSNLPVVRGVGSFPAGAGLPSVTFDEAERLAFFGDQCLEGVPPTLTLAKARFAIDEELEARFSSPPEYRSKTWVALFRATDPSGNREFHSRHDLDFRDVGGLAEGVLTFRAPKSAGSYEFRMFHRDTGQELTKTAFQVAASIEAVGLMQGTFDTSYGEMRLTATGGTYNHEGGRISITSISGNVMEGVWEQTTSGEKCEDGRYWGRFRFTFSASGFKGNYGRCGEDPSRSGWDGTRVLVR